MLKGKVVTVRVGIDLCYPFSFPFSLSFLYVVGHLCFIIFIFDFDHRCRRDRVRIQLAREDLEKHCRTVNRKRVD